jgi:hypothetical protein
VVIPDELFDFAHIWIHFDKRTREMNSYT